MNAKVFFRHIFVPFVGHTEYCIGFVKTHSAIIYEMEVFSLCWRLFNQICFCRLWVVLVFFTYSRCFFFHFVSYRCLRFCLQFYIKSRLNQSKIWVLTLDSEKKNRNKYTKTVLFTDQFDFNVDLIFHISQLKCAVWCVWIIGIAWNRFEDQQKKNTRKKSTSYQNTRFYSFQEPLNQVVEATRFCIDGIIILLRTNRRWL